VTPLVLLGKKIEFQGRSREKRAGKRKLVKEQGAAQSKKYPPGKGAPNGVSRVRKKKAA